MLFRMAIGNSQHLELFPNWLIPVENKSYATYLYINRKHMADVINSIEEPHFYLQLFINKTIPSDAKLLSLPQ